MNPLTQGNKRSYEPDYNANVSGGERRGTFLPLLFAFAVQIIADYDYDKPLDKQVRPLLREQNLLGWGVLFISLSAMTDFDTTRELAIAFAWLILIASLAYRGKAFFDKLDTLVRIFNPAQPAKKGK